MRALPVSEAAGFPNDAPDDYRVGDVEDLGKGRYRVTGISTHHGEQTKSVGFTCEVAPDKSDRLRGFKVTKLEVTSAR